MKNVRMTRIALWVTFFAFTAFLTNKASASEANPARLTVQNLKNYNFPTLADPGTTLRIYKRGALTWDIHTEIKLNNGEVRSAVIYLRTGRPHTYSFKTNKSFSNREDPSIQPNNQISELLGGDPIEFDHLPLYINNGGGVQTNNFHFQEPMTIKAMHLENCELQTFNTVNDNEIECELELHIAMQSKETHAIQLFSISFGKPISH